MSEVELLSNAPEAGAHSGVGWIGEKSNPIVGGRMSGVYTRVLLPSDAQNLREVRLEALQKEGRLFASSYAIESKFPFENWERKCTEDDKHCAMGLFAGAGLIGISLVVPYDNDTSGKTGLLGQSYMEKSSFESAVVYVRDDNGVSIALNRKAGAQYLETREMMCGDGQLALWHWYKFPLASASSPVSKTSAPTLVSRASVSDQMFMAGD